MTRSMTAFARREVRGDWGGLSWELRSVNHRYLETAVRMPEDLRSIEPAVRERVSERLSRGKVECNLRFQAAVGGAAGVTVNLPFAQQLVEASHQVAALLGEAAPASPVELLRWPGVVEAAHVDLDPVIGAALEGLDEALSELVETRSREGAKLKELLLQRCGAMEVIVGDVRRRLPEVTARLRERLQTRLEELKGELDENRLEQEMVILAQRMDVDEEMDRLAAHIGEVRRVLDRDEAIGRRLDFLMQELNREANTLASKSSDSETTRAAVDLKVLIEQMREQVQNIE
jgi:uncharacterized protein (TIGR00255 family)